MIVSLLETTKGRVLSRSRFALIVVLLGVLGGICFLAIKPIKAYYHLQAGRKALAAYQLTQARSHLNACLDISPNNSPARFMAIRAARLAEDYEDVERLLKQVQQEQGVSDNTNLEWAMLQAHYGDLDSVEGYLKPLVGEGHPDSAYILDALVAGYVRMYRNTDALGSIQLWLNQEPDCIQALCYRGRIYQRLHDYKKAIDDFDQVVQTDPDRDEARLRLTACLLEAGRFAEALEHAKRLYKSRPDDEEMNVFLSMCHYGLGQFEEANDLLNGLLKKNPDYGPALIGSGQIALHNGDPNKALANLRRAVDLSPIDMRANHELYRCLEQLGMTAEAEKQHQKLLQVQKNVERLIEISNRDMAKNPKDPALHAELGQLMLTLGQRELGHRWLLSALQKDPRFQPAHKALAEYYEKSGDVDKAKLHGELAQKAPISKKASTERKSP